MNRHHRKRAVWLTLVLLVGLVLTGVLWLRAERRQYALNRQLIAALVKGDDGQALALVNAGADPNTPYWPTPKPSLLQLVKQLLHRSSPPTNNSLTAFLMACGTYWVDGRPPEYPEDIRRYSYDARLVQTMLAHDANVNAQSKTGWTALMWAMMSGADKGIIQRLLTHGANPNLAGPYGNTPLSIAQAMKYPDIIALLKHAGARK